MLHRNTNRSLLIQLEFVNLAAKSDRKSVASQQHILFPRRPAKPPGSCLPEPGKSK